jgi:cytochrome c-type biogenesis protein CcmH/NrfG
MKNFIFLFCVVFMCGCGSPASKVFGDKKARDKVDYLQEGIKDLNNHNIKKAIADLHRSIKQNPNSTKAYLILGELYLRLKAYDISVKYYLAASKLDPQNGKIFLSLAKSYSLGGNKQKAILSVKKALILFEAKKDIAKFKTAASLLHMLINAEEKVE